MQVLLLNCHLAIFLEFEWIVQKAANENLITLVCVIALASYITIAQGKLYPLGHNLISVLCSYQLF